MELQPPENGKPGRPGGSTLVSAWNPHNGGLEGAQDGRAVLIFRAPLQPPTYAAPIISSQKYVSPSPVDLVVVRRVLGDILKEGKIIITDTNGNMVFKVKANFLSIRGQLLLVDVDGKPIFTLQRRVLTMHDRWEAYKGESTEDCDLMFTVKKCAMVQMKTKLQVFMAKNTKEYACDYRVEGTFLQDSCTVYVGETNTVAAQMHKKLSFENLLGKERFAVTVYPNVDHAFIAALIVILDGINRPGWI